MPFPVALALLGGQLISSSMAADSQSEANRKNIEAQMRANADNQNFAKTQSLLQRRYALEDWNSQNAYNHPLEQMKRLREAGLNPNLVYGTGTQTIAQQVRSSPQATATAQAPQVAPIPTPDFTSMVGQYADIQQRQVQTDNLRAQAELMQKDAMLKDIKIGQSSLDYDTSRRIQDSVVKRVQLDNELKLLSSKQAIQNMDVQLKQLDLQTKANTADVLLKMVSTAAAKQQIRNAEKDGRLKQYELELNKYNIQKSDAVYWRLLLKSLNLLNE